MRKTTRGSAGSAWYIAVVHQGKLLSPANIACFVGPFPSHLAAEAEIKRAEQADYSTVNNQEAIPYGLQANLMGPASDMRKEWGLRDFAYGDDVSNVIGTQIPIDPFELNVILEERGIDTSD